MISTGKLTEDWYVVFTKSDTKHWLTPWLNPDFGHVKMVKEDLGLWVIVDSGVACTRITTKLIDDYPHIRILCPNAVILPVRTVIDATKFQWHLGINSCVDTAKGILGIRKMFMNTPYQLYKYLIAEQKNVD